MSTSMTLLLVCAAVTLLNVPMNAQAPAGPCALLTSAEAEKYIARGRPTYGQEPSLTSVGSNGAVCDYPDGQVGLWKAPNAEQNHENFMKAWKVDKTRRTPVSGVGDRAWIMFPVPEDKYKDRAAYLVAHVGQQILTVALFAHDGQADSWMGDVCRKDAAKLKPKEQADCKKVLADTSETQESLQPAVVDLAKRLVDRVRSGK